MDATVTRIRQSIGDKLRAQCVTRGLTFRPVVWRDMQAYEIDGLKYSVREACDLLLPEN